MSTNTMAMTRRRMPGADRRQIKMTFNDLSLTANSLLDKRPRPREGKAASISRAVTGAIQETCFRSERPTIHRRPRPCSIDLSRAKVAGPSSKAVRARIDQADRKKLDKAQDRCTRCTSAIRSRHAMETVQSDHYGDHRPPLWAGLGEETTSSLRSKAFRQSELGPSAQDRHAPLPTLVRPVLAVRLGNEYRQLARDIIESQIWKSLQSKSGRDETAQLALMVSILNGE